MERVYKLVELYNKKYSTKFKLGEPYNLYPNDENEYGFYREWPSNGKGGVYLILDKNKEVIYVGETNSFGRRFASYFTPDVDRRCIVKSEYWKGTPHYIITLEAPDEALYERLSLEAYLIKELEPIDNTKYVG